jgi:hypothetical protein
MTKSLRFIDDAFRAELADGSDGACPQRLRRLRTNYSYLYKNSNTVPRRLVRRPSRIDCGATANRNPAKVKVDDHADEIQRC